MHYFRLATPLDALGKPTPHQMSLIKGALRGIWVQRIDQRHAQQRLFETWQARMALLEALSLLK
ncbi:hypothetical protein [Calothrix sp. PCC 7507]|uniref:hypothetical protein n=1 Tax=Calothrix sp. PCC 7507 TaxID=99598 RepID=UPI00029F1DE6|nr:hypothetical protein [Calothrix sp. PCC 7507]AFY31965.1 hypothetical protein Cal7507_1501 [Calothrix sp. PCC 7507]